MTEQEFEDPTAEIEAMKKVAEALMPLNGEAQTRVLSWAVSRFSNEAVLIPMDSRKTNQDPNRGNPDQVEQNSNFASFAELIENVDLKSNSDRALFAAYWIQEIQKEDSFDGRSINKLLKEHGIDVSNVTNALASLINTKPRQAMQAGKKGKFEKLYRLTTEGKKEVMRRLSEGKSND